MYSDEVDKAASAILDALSDQSREILLENGWTYRLMKDGHIWDYSTHLVDVRRWTMKILAEEPDARVEVELSTVEEWTAWRTSW